MIGVVLKSAIVYLSCIGTLLLPVSQLRAQDSVDEETRRFVTGMFSRPSYLAPDGGCEKYNRSFLNWAGGELIRCRYTVTDRKADGSTEKKDGIVLLAATPPERILAWLVAACNRADATASDRCVQKAANEVCLASGGQFPVAGVVWEDMDGDRIHTAFAFRNGVTVRTRLFDNGRRAAFSENELEKAITEMQVEGIKPDGGYARIISTTRKQLRALTGRKDIPVGKSDRTAALLWSDQVGEIYRSSLSNDENLLILAKLRFTDRSSEDCSF